MILARGGQRAKLRLARSLERASELRRTRGKKRGERRKEEEEEELRGEQRKIPSPESPKGKKIFEGRGPVAAIGDEALVALFFFPSQVPPQGDEQKEARPSALDRKARLVSLYRRSGRN